MNKELRDKWVVALRSGKYQQGTGYLRKGHGYCCLGVLCDVVDPTRWEGATTVGYFYYNPTDGHRNSDVAYLPEEIRALAQLPAGTESELTRMNDTPDENLSFAQIADWIEGHL